MPMPPADTNAPVKQEDWRQPRPLSCKECRRAKLRCDRKVPCGSCQRRGCANICPNGVIATGPVNVNRGMLADNRKMQEKASAMRARILELEHAIRALRGEPSPPLDIDDMSPPMPSGVSPLSSDVLSPPEDDAPPQQQQDLATAFGTLDIGDRPTFVGPNAMSNYFAPRSSTSPPPTHSSSSSSSKPKKSAPLYIILDPTYPISSQRTHIIAQLVTHLPPTLPLALTLLEVWLQGVWMGGEGAGSRILLTPLIHKLYNGDYRDGQVDLHAVSVLFMVFAHASLHEMDGRVREGGVAARRFYEVACDVLCVDSVFARPTLDGIGALFLMSWYLQSVADAQDPSAAYNIHGIMARLCYSLGLHRNDDPWNLDPAERQRRRSLFWDAVTVEYYVAENMGRPPIFTPAQMDANLPEDSEPYPEKEDGTPQPSFLHWDHTFSQRCLIPLLSQAFGTARVDHATVLRLDKLIRTHPCADILQITSKVLEEGEVGTGTWTAGDVDPSPSVPMLKDGQGVDFGELMLRVRRYIVYILTQKMLLLLHRPFFVMALRNGALSGSGSPSPGSRQDDDLTSGPHKSNVLATFDAALGVCRAVRGLLTILPFARSMWFIWNAVFSACAIFGAVIVHRPYGPLAKPAGDELEATYGLLQRLAPDQKNIARLMPQLDMIRSAAHDARNKGERASNSPPTVLEQELSYMLGQARVVGRSSASPVVHRSVPVQQASPPQAHQHQQPQQPHQQHLHQQQPPHQHPQQHPQQHTHQRQHSGYVGHDLNNMWQGFITHGATSSGGAVAEHVGYAQVQNGYQYGYPAALSGAGAGGTGGSGRSYSYGGPLAQ